MAASISTAASRGKSGVAGGIGIAPFIGRLQALADSGNGDNVDFFYCTSAPDRGFIERIRELAERAGCACTCWSPAKAGG